MEVAARVARQLDEGQRARGYFIMKPHIHPVKERKIDRTVVEVAARVAVEAPGVDLLHVLPQRQRPPLPDGAVQAGVAAAGAPRVALGVAPQAVALRDEALLLEAACSRRRAASAGARGVHALQIVHPAKALAPPH